MLVGCDSQEKGPLAEGRLLEDQGKHQEAIRFYTKMIKEEPNNARAYVARGRCRASQGDAEEAIRNYTKAISIDPKYGEAYQLRAVAYYAKLNYGQSWDDLLKAKQYGAQIDQSFVEHLTKETRKRALELEKV